ncbi:MAG: hypothetical protein H7Y14_07220 [Burkholderiales bacterium]|nr:hypothetical protein [Burkholderiales bacterium]
MKTVPVSLCAAAFVLAATSAGGQSIDWSRAKFVDYKVEGVYQAETSLVAGERSAMADVMDRVVLRFRWDLQNAKLVGAATIENFASQVKNLHPDPAGCTQPVLNGPYEHFTATALVDGLGGDLHLSSVRSRPDTVVMAGCVGRKTVKARKDEEMEALPVPSPELLALPVPAGAGQAISADRRSMVRKEHGWTWTYTPSVQK